MHVCRQEVWGRWYLLPQQCSINGSQVLLSSSWNNPERHSLCSQKVPLIPCSNSCCINLFFFPPQFLSTVPHSTPRTSQIKHLHISVWFSFHFWWKSIQILTVIMSWIPATHPDFFQTRVSLFSEKGSQVPQCPLPGPLHPQPQWPWP